MSKRENDFYYSFTSPSMASSSGAPSAPPNNDELAPPSYDEAAVLSSATKPSPPPNKLNYDGYVLDSANLPLNSNALPIPMPNALSMPMPTPQESTISDYEPYLEQSADAPLLGDTESRIQEYENFVGRPAPPGYSLYRAKFKTVKEGIISRDRHINQDGEALVQFLHQHNSRPRMLIHFYGKVNINRLMNKTKFDIL